MKPLARSRATMPPATALIDTAVLRGRRTRLRTANVNPACIDAAKASKGPGRDGPLGRAGPGAESRNRMTEFSPMRPDPRCRRILQSQAAARSRRLFAFELPLQAIDNIVKNNPQRSWHTGC
jgi:hypothetical protein